MKIEDESLINDVAQLIAEGKGGLLKNAIEFLKGQESQQAEISGETIIPDVKFGTKKSGEFLRNRISTDSKDKHLSFEIANAINRIQESLTHSIRFFIPENAEKRIPVMPVCTEYGMAVAVDLRTAGCSIGILRSMFSDGRYSCIPVSIDYLSDERVGRQVEVFYYTAQMNHELAEICLIIPEQDILTGRCSYVFPSMTPDWDLSCVATSLENISVCVDALYEKFDKTKSKLFKMPIQGYKLIEPDEIDKEQTPVLLLDGTVSNNVICSLRAMTGSQISDDGIVFTTKYGAETFQMTYVGDNANSARLCLVQAGPEVIDVTDDIKLTDMIIVLADLENESVVSQ